MGNYFGKYGKCVVHPALQPLLPEGVSSEAGPSKIKVRMTAREFKELVARAEARKCNTSAVVGMLIMEGVQQGRWEAVRVSDGGEASGGDRGDARAALETIHED